jgi:hypothetical protein
VADIWAAATAVAADIATTDEQKSPGRYALATHQGIFRTAALAVRA